MGLAVTNKSTPVCKSNKTKGLEIINSPMLDGILICLYRCSKLRNSYYNIEDGQKDLQY